MEEESWNMATATLKRFDFILKQCSVMAQTGDLIGWFNVLRDLRRNLYPFIPDTEWREVEVKFASLPKKWRSKNGTIGKNNFPIVSKKLDEIYMIFIKTMKSKGLLMPRSIDSSKAVIEM